jgi:hypothetical protein
MEEVITSEYTEFAQSYMAQPLMVLGSFFSMALAGDDIIRRKNRKNPVRQ